MAIEVGDAVLKLGIDTADLDRGMKGIRGKLQQHSKAIGLGMTAMGAAIVGGLGLATKSAAEFESAMREVNTMMGLGQEEFATFSAEVQQLSMDLGVNAVESAQALYQAISAGIPRENVLEFLEIATKAAIGGMTDTETAVDGLTTVLNAFRMPVTEAKNVADIMFTTVEGGKTTMDELSNSLFNVAPIAKASGVSFVEVSAALATMTKQGVPTAVATTQLRAAIQAMTAPTIRQEKHLAALGLEMSKEQMETKGLAVMMDELVDATGGNMAQLRKLIGSVEGVQAVLALAGENTEAFAADLAAMEGAAGASQGAFEEMELSTSRQLEKLKQSFGGIIITVGNVLIPILSELVAMIMPVVRSIIDWTKEHPGLTKVIVIATGVLGGLLLVLGPLLLMLPGIIAIAPAVGLAFHTMLPHIGLITLAIAGLVAGGILLWQNWDTISAKATEIWEGIKNFFVGIWDSIVGIFKEHRDKILLVLFPAVGLPILIARHWDTIVDTFKDIGGNLVEGLWEGIQSMASWIWDKVKGFAEGIFDSIKEGFGKLWPFSPSEAGIEIGEGLTAGILEGVESTLSGVTAAMAGIKSQFKWDGISQLALPRQDLPGGEQPTIQYPPPIIHVYLDSREVGQGVGQYAIDEEQAPGG